MKTEAMKNIECILKRGFNDVDRHHMAVRPDFKDKGWKKKLEADLALVAEMFNSEFKIKDDGKSRYITVTFTKNSLGSV